MPASRAHASAIPSCCIIFINKFLFSPLHLLTLAWPLLTGCKYFPEQVSDADRNSVTGSIRAIHAYMDGVPYQKNPLYTVHSNGYVRLPRSVATSSRRYLTLFVLSSDRSSSDESRVDPPRNVFIHRTTQDVGIRLKGGNATGVFVAEILPDSACAGSDLMVGDQILEINGRNLQAAIAEQVATELNRPADSLNIVVQYNTTSEFY